MAIATESPGLTACSESLVPGAGKENCAQESAGITLVGSASWSEVKKLPVGDVR